MPWKQYLELGVSGLICGVFAMYNAFLKKQLRCCQSRNDALQELLLASKDEHTTTQKETVARLLKRLELKESGVVRKSSTRDKKKT